MCTIIYKNSYILVTITILMMGRSKVKGQGVIFHNVIHALAFFVSVVWSSRDGVPLYPSLIIQTPRVLKSTFSTAWGAVSTHWVRNVPCVTGNNYTYISIFLAYQACFSMIKKLHILGRFFKNICKFSWPVFLIGYTNSLLLHQLVKKL